MNYRILISKGVKKQILKLPEGIRERILLSFQALSHNPRLSGSKKLRGRIGYRIRIGDYRIVYDIDDEQRDITLMKVGHRKEFY